MVTAKINVLWGLVEKENFDKLHRRQFQKLFMSLYKLLLPMFYKPVVIKLVQDLLTKYYHEVNYIDYNDFYNAIYEFVELFTISNEAKEYADFLYWLTQRIVLKRVALPDGTSKDVLPDIHLFIPNREEMKARWTERFKQIFYQNLFQQDKEEAKRKRLQEERQESLKEMQIEKPKWEPVAEGEPETDEYQYKEKEGVKMKRIKIDGMTYEDSGDEEEQDKAKRIFDPSTVPDFTTDYYEYREYCDVDLVSPVEEGVRYVIMEYEQVVPVGVALYANFVECADTKIDEHKYCIDIDYSKELQNKDLAFKMIFNIFDVKALKARTIKEYSEQDFQRIKAKLESKDTTGTLFKFMRICEWTLEFFQILDRKLTYDWTFNRDDYLVTPSFFYKYSKTSVKSRKIDSEQICFPKPLKYQQNDEQIFEERYKLIENTFIHFLRYKYNEIIKFDDLDLEFEKEKKRRKNKEDNEKHSADKEVEGNLVIRSEPDYVQLDSNTFKFNSEIKHSDYLYNYVFKDVEIEQDGLDDRLDLQLVSNRAPLQILILGAPSSKKNQLAASIAKKFDIININVEEYINSIVEDYRNLTLLLKAEEKDEEAIKELEVKVPVFVRPIMENLLKGGDIDQVKYLEIMSYLVNRNLIQLKGYVYAVADGFTYQNLELVLKSKVNFVIRVECSSKDILINYKVDQMNRNMYCKKYLKPRNEEDDDEDDPMRNVERYLWDFDVKKNIELTIECQNLDMRLNQYNILIQKTYNKLINSLYLSQQCVLDPLSHPFAECLEKVELSLRSNQNKLNPYYFVPKSLEGGSFKELLKVQEENYLAEDFEKNERHEFPNYKWSPFNFVDPVELKDFNKIIEGKPELAVEYAGRIFVFAKEENRVKFIKKPRFYLRQQPKVPESNKILVVSPYCDKDQILDKLSKHLNIEKYDMLDLVRNIVEDYENTDLLSRLPDKKIPRKDIETIESGMDIKYENFMGCFLHNIGITHEVIPRLENKNLKTNEEEQEDKGDKPIQGDENLETENDYVDIEQIKKLDEEYFSKLTCNDFRLSDKYQPESLQDKGFILTNCVQSVNDIKSLLNSSYGIVFDFVIVIDDTSEDKSYYKATYGEAQVEEIKSKVEQIVAELNKPEYLGAHEEQPDKFLPKFITIDVNQPDDILFNRTVNSIDLFFPKVDDPENVMNNNQDYDGNFFKSEYGNYGPFCPLALRDESFLLRGNPATEVYIDQKCYRLSTDNEEVKNSFVENYFKYYKKDKVEIPPPRILIIGPRGVGTSTLIDKACSEFKLKNFKLYKNFTERFEKETQDRKYKKFYSQRFNEELNEEEMVDPLLESEEEGAYDKWKESLIRALYREESNYDWKEDGLLIDGNFIAEKEAEISLEVFDLLFKTKHMPEVVFFLNSDFDKMVNRIVNEDVIKENYRSQLKDKRAEKQKEVDERIKEMRDSSEEEEEIEKERIQLWADFDADIEDNFKYDEFYKNECENYEERYNKDVAAIEELKAKLGEYIVETHDVNCNFNDVNVAYKRLTYRLRDYIAERHNRIESEMVVYTDAKQAAEKCELDEDQPETHSAIVNSFVDESMNFRVKWMLSLGLLRLSKYGLRDPFEYHHYDSTRFPLVYRNRVYWFRTRENLEKFKQHPLNYLHTSKIVPYDTKISVSFAVSGAPLSGKTSFCKNVAKEYNLDYIYVPELIEEALNIKAETNNILSHRVRLHLRDHAVLSDELTIELIKRRIQSKHSYFGFVLDNFPQTRDQAELMVKNNIRLNYFIELAIDTNKVFGIYESLLSDSREQLIETQFDKPKVEGEEDEDDGEEKIRVKTLRTVDNRVYAGSRTRTELVLQYKKYLVNKLDLQGFYSLINSTYKNVDNNCNLWGLMSKINDEINIILSKTIKVCYNLNHGLPVSLNVLPILKTDLMDITTKDMLVKKYNVPYFEYCPFEYVFNNFYVKCNKKSNLYFYNYKFYYISNLKYNTFDNFKSLNDIKKIEVEKIPSMPDYPDIGRTKHYDAAMQGNCIVHIFEHDDIYPGSSLKIAKCDNKTYFMKDEQSLLKYIKQPSKYKDVKIPVFVKPTKIEIHTEKLSSELRAISELENVLGLNLSKALVDLGHIRPKFIGLDFKESALLFLSLYLRAYSDYGKPFYKENYKEKLEKFIRMSKVVQTYKYETDKRQKLKELGQWKEFNERIYNSLGKEIDKLIENFQDQDADNIFKFFE